MKRYVSLAALIFLCCCIIIGISSCRKTSTTPPVITLIGASKDTVSLNSSYSDPGATATDAADGTDAVSSDFGPTNPNVNLVGTYVVSYSAYDNAGNTATKKRTVVVVNDAQYLASTDSVIDVISAGGKNAGTYHYRVYVSVSPTTNNELFVSDFSDLGSSVTIALQVFQNGVFLNPSSQRPSGMKDQGTISNGSGSISSGKITYFNYKIFYDSGGSDQCASSTWIKL